MDIDSIAIAKEFSEFNWKRETKESLYDIVSKAKNNSPEMNFLFYPESAGACVGCSPQYMMVYADGRVYDL